MLSVENLSVYYFRQRRPCIRDVKFRAEAGEVIGIVGPSASGKSTLAGALCGAFVPGNPRSERLRTRAARLLWSRLVFGWYDGTISGGSARLGANDAWALQPQELLLYEDRSMGYNLSPSGSIPDEAQSDLLERLFLPEDTTTPVRNLSGGQRRRLAVARALLGAIHGNGRLILDEPFEGLEANVRARLGEVIRERTTKHGLCCLLISHNLHDCVSVADALLVLNSHRTRPEFLRNTAQDASAAAPPLRLYLAEGNALSLASARTNPEPSLVLPASDFTCLPTATSEWVLAGRVDSVNHWSNAVRVYVDHQDLLHYAQTVYPATEANVILQDCVWLHVASSEMPSPGAVVYLRPAMPEGNGAPYD